MRVLVVVAGLVGCGRLDFDTRAPTGDAAARDGSSADTPVGQACVLDTDCGRCARCGSARTCEVEPVVDLFLGHRSTCIVGTGGTRWCAGENSMAELGVGDVSVHSTPTRVADGDGWEAIYLSFYSATRAIRGGQLYTWGGNASNTLPASAGAAPDARGVLGDDNFKCFWFNDGTAPATCDPSGSVWRSLAYGSEHFCGVKLDGTLWCWGTNHTNALGLMGVAADAVVANPTQVGALNNWVEVSTGGNVMRGSTCARNTSNEIRCWGHKALTGTNQVDVGITPTLVATDTDWAWLQTEWERTCAGKPDGRVFCWGSDTYGGFVAIGTATAFVPTLIPSTYTRWEMGGHHACGIDGGRWRCFGWNTSGQLGVGNTVNDGQLVDLCP